MFTYSALSKELDRLEKAFDIIYKRVNKQAVPKTESLVIRHLNDLIKLYNQLKLLCLTNSKDYTTEQVQALTKRLQTYFTKLENAFDRAKRKLIRVPNEPIPLLQEIPLSPEEEQAYAETVTEEDQQEEDEFQDTRDHESDPTQTNMSISSSEFLKIATQSLPTFDGKAENLQTFIDGLNLVETFVGNNADIALAVIKTKLSGNARTLITDENTIPQIIATLRNRVRGESSAVIQAKMDNVRQGSKTANAYIREIEDLSRMLESSYIAEGIPSVIAAQFSTQAAVKSVANNANNENVKLIVKAGNFNSMNELVAKFVSTATEASSPTSILYTRRGNNRGRGNNNRNNNNRRNNNYRGNNNNNGNNYRNNNNGNNNQNRGQNRGRGNNSNNNNNRNNNGGNNGYRGNNRNNVYHASQGNGQPTNQQDRLGDNLQ